jgi:hypothetical protein
MVDTLASIEPFIYILAMICLGLAFSVGLIRLGMVSVKLYRKWSMIELSFCLMHLLLLIAIVVFYLNKYVYFLTITSLRVIQIAGSIIAVWYTMVSLLELFKRFLVLTPNLTVQSINKAIIIYTLLYSLFSAGSIIALYFDNADPANQLVFLVKQS